MSYLIIGKFVFKSNHEKRIHQNFDYKKKNAHKSNPKICMTKPKIPCLRRKTDETKLNKKKLIYFFLQFSFI